MSEWIKKNPNICCIQKKKNHFKYEDTDRLKVKGHRKVKYANTNKKKAASLY